MSEWIKCEDRMPEKSEKVFVHLKNGIMTAVWYSSKYRKFNCFDDIEPGGYAFNDVTHWMPLPEPPEEDKP